MTVAGNKRKRAGHRDQPHPYLSGNFAPVKQTRPLTPCTYTGTIPTELVGSQYVRNGGNPVSNEDLGRDAHWFDGDGMLSGVLFRRIQGSEQVQPEFVNQFILTDVYLSTISTPEIRSPILPSIATLVNPASTFFLVIAKIFRTIILVLLSHLPGSTRAIRKISVANTGVLYHDGRALATCESGPPIRIQLPGLETVGWYDGIRAEGEPESESSQHNEVFGGEGLLSWMREWTTGHPKVDPVTHEMILYHCCFQPPFVRYSVIPPEKHPQDQPAGPRLINAPVSRVSGSKMMHDFGVSLRHTVLMDLPLSLDAFNLVLGKPSLVYDPTKPSRFGVFPRREPHNVQWFETDACCIFHTANTWDTIDSNGKTISVNLLACRQNSASIVYGAGNVMPPTTKTTRDSRKRMALSNTSYPSEYNTAEKTEADSFISNTDHDLEHQPLLACDVSNHPLTSTPNSDEQCYLYYYNFDLQSHTVTAQYALTALTFEFPSVRPSLEMQAARYIYGCSSSQDSFGTALGRVAGIDVLVKIDAAALIARAQANPPPSITGIVDPRSTADILNSPADPNDPVQCFRMPERWYAQEPRFVPREPSRSEDDGFLLFYAFDEAQLDERGECGPNCYSELWVLDAKSMSEVVAKIRLPQRVPYGLHANWFSEGQVMGQRAVDSVRSVGEAEEEAKEGGKCESLGSRAWMGLRRRILNVVG